MENTIDFSLPHTNESLKFIKLSPDDKLKAIVLGMKFLNMGNQQMQIWENSQWESRIETIKSQKQDIIDAMQEKVHLVENKMKKLIQNQKNEMDKYSISRALS